MSRERDQGSSSRRGRFALLYAFYCVVVAAIFFAAGELVLRARGEEPWNPVAAEIHVEPGGRFYQSDDVLGYRQIPGRFEVELASGYRFRVTHGPDSLRIVRPPASPVDPQAQGVWIFGGSFTHGWSVDDEDTYLWQLQAQRPDLDVVNFGVNGYGTLHGLLQLRRALAERRPPRIAVLAYGGFHDVRNTFLRTRQKRVEPFSRLGPLAQPYARLENGELRIATASGSFCEWPGMRSSAFIHFLERQYNAFEDRRQDSGAVTRALVRTFAREARAAGADPLVATITTGHAAARMRAAAVEQGIAATDISVDLEVPGMRNLPHDSHPAAPAHRAYAQRLDRALRELGLAPR